MKSDSVLLQIFKWTPQRLWVFVGAAIVLVVWALVDLVMAGYQWMGGWLR